TVPLPTKAVLPYSFREVVSTTAETLRIGPSLSRTWTFRIPMAPRDCVPPRFPVAIGSYRESPDRSAVGSNLRQHFATAHARQVDVWKDRAERSISDDLEALR